MTKNIVLQVVTVLCAVVSVIICFSLLAKHITGNSIAPWFDWGCSVSATPSGSGCAVVLKSPYSYWPAKDASGASLPNTYHWPVAFGGMVYYSLIGIWYIVVGRPDAKRRWLHWVPTLMVVVGLASSAYYVYIMFTKISEWCPWCMVTHGLNLIIAVCTFLLWPRSGVAAATETAHELPTAGVVRAARAAASSPTVSTLPEPIVVLPRHPSWRLVMAAFLGMSLAALGEMQMLFRFDVLIREARSLGELNQYKGVVDRLRGDHDKLMRMWDASEPRNIPVREDDPIRLPNASSDQPFVDLIVFSDFECPSCKSTAEFIDQQVQRMFTGKLRIIFKHFPLDPKCNSHVPNVPGIHPNACTAATLAEAARLQGGNDAFWKAHDYLFQRQQPGAGLSGISIDDFAKALALDPARLSTDMAGAAVKQRINEDIEEAKKSGIRATPMLLVSNKPVDGLAVKELGFWDRLAESYWYSLKLPRPQNTLMQQPSATPGTPAKPNAP